MAEEKDIVDIDEKELQDSKGILKGDVSIDSFRTEKAPKRLLRL